MKVETIIWTVIFIAAGLFLVARVAFSEHGMGRAYVKDTPREFVNIAAPGQDADWIDVHSDEADGLELQSIQDDARRSWVKSEQSTYADYRKAVAADPAQDVYHVSFWRTFGLWVAAFFTLAILSFVYRDNAFYKFAESVFVGVSAAYWMVVGFWTVIVPNLFGKLVPLAVQAWAMPGLSGKDLQSDLLYIIPLILGVMLLWRLSPVGGWIARWPLAFIIGVFCGLRLVGFLHADFLSQIRNSIMPIIVVENGVFDFWDSLRNFLLIGGVLVCLVYFFFSLEHKGAVGRVAKVGIWVLMITFGAGFGYTVMGRIALLAIRIEFLFDDWLWLIDPRGKREIISTLMTWRFTGGG